MGQPAESSMTCYSSILVVLFCTFVASSKLTIEKKMMEDMGRSVSNSNTCYTPSNLKTVFLQVCEEVLNGNITQCSFAWTAFNIAFGLKDPNTLTLQDYDTYFDVLTAKTRANSNVYWSGSSLRSVVEEVSTKRNVISSSVNLVSSRIIDIMIKDHNVMCWCGNTTAYLDTVNPCPITPVVAFWQAFSNHFGESGRGIVYYIGDGSRAGGAYKKDTFFATFEFPKLISDRVKKLIVINIYDCNNIVVERCGEGTLEVLQNLTVGKYGTEGYACKEVCGSTTDKQQLYSLAAKVIQIIKAEQIKVTTVSFNQSSYIANEANRYAEITLVLSSVLPVDVTIQVNNEDITARSRRYSYDYYSGPYSIIFPAGLTTASFIITIVDDSSLELTNETFSLTIDPLLPEDVTHGRLDTATVIIVSDEVGISFNQSSYYVDEGSNRVQIEVYLTSPLPFDVNATINENGGTATRSIDYFSGQYLLKFPAGVTNVTFHVLIADDKLIENSEYIYFIILHETLHYLVKRFRYIGLHVYIQDDDFTTINFNQSTYSVHENHGYVKPMLVLTSPFPTDLTIRIRHRSETAHAGNDFYGGYYYYATIPAGVTSVSFNFEIHNDALIEGYERFHLYIPYQSSDVLVGNLNEATVTIVDDDTFRLNFKKAAYSVYENAKEIELQMELNKPRSSELTVQIKDIDITTIGNTDYSPGPYSVTFPAGMTTASFDIIIIDDSFTEENEQFYLTIDPLTLSSDVMFDNLNAAVITIVDDDVTTINFDKSVYSIDEVDGAIHPVLTLSNPLLKTVTVKVLSTDGSAIGYAKSDASSGLSAIDVYDEVQSQDYHSGPYNVTLTAGVTYFPFKIPILDDKMPEEDENFILAIDPFSLPCSLTVGNLHQATVTIMEDEAEKCVVNTITGKVDHNHKTKRTVLTFEADNPSATYTCKLDKQSHKSCTSPVIWKNLSSGKHSVNVRARCLIDGVAYSSTSIRIEFRVR